MSGDPRPLLRLRGISKFFGGVEALGGVDLDIADGEVHAIIGENGAGKSTLMNVIGGVVSAGAGRFEWRGRPERPRNPRHARDLGISFVHQELALVPQLSAAENIFLGHHPARAGWVRWRQIHDSAARLLRELGRDFDPARPVAELSLAERQLVEIARTLAFQSRLIIMDEPTAPLDDRDAEALFGTVRRLAARGIAVIFITHRLKEVFQVADRVTVLRDGRHVLTTGTAQATMEGLVRAMVGSELADAAASRPQASAGPAPEALRVDEPGGLVLRPGEIVGLAGLAGAGRTELLEWLFGAGKAGGPRLLVDGIPVRIRSPRDAIRHGLALVPDDRKAKGLVLGASLADNIALAAARKPWWIRGAAETRAAAGMAAELRIRTAGPGQPVAKLSGGNQQKVVLAKWLAAGARVLLLDEPTRGIDVRSKAEIHEIIRAQARRGAAVLLASSDTDELLRLADRILVMHRGRIAGELSAAEATEERIMRLAT